MKNIINSLYSYRNFYQRPTRHIYQAYYSKETITHFLY